MNIGDKTREVWIGDTITECEFLGQLPDNRMLFFDTKFRCFRAVFFQVEEGNVILNGMEAASKPSELL